MRILCVCLGNICRSPTAEAVLREKAGQGVEIDSAGMGSWHVGQPPHGPAIAAAAARGYDMSGLRGRQFGARDFTDFDLILAMDRQNLADIEAMRPKGNATPVRLMLAYLPDRAQDDVPDPYYTGEFELALDLIEAAAIGVLDAVD